jgi:hypothetical protein
VSGSLPFCPKHLEVEKRRAVKSIEKQRAQAARAEAAWLARNLPHLPRMRVHLERAEAEYARRTASRVDDRAAYGGAMHPAVRRAQQSALSDSNVARVVELGRIIERLRADISRAEGAAS